MMLVHKPHLMQAPSIKTILAPFQVEDVSLVVTSNPVSLVHVGDVQPAFWVED